MNRAPMAMRPRRDAENNDDDYPRRRKRRRPKSSNVGFLIGGIAAGIVLFAGVGIGCWLLLTGSPALPPIAQQHAPANAVIPDVPRDAVPNPPPAVAQANPAPEAVKLPSQIAADTVGKVKKATVFLNVTTPLGEQAQGSGFFVSAPGIVITNAHVLGMLSSTSPPPEKIEAIINSGEPDEFSVPGKILGVDRMTDLAVLRVEGILPPPLLLDESNALVETQKVYIFGFPFGQQLGKNITVSESSVSSLRKDATGTLERIQVNGGMHSGNSGGPVVDASGKVVGVSVAVIRGTQINFAIPGHFVNQLLGGRILDANLGEPYIDNGGVHVTLNCSCLDPFQRIRMMRAEVWSGAPGSPRPGGAQKPRSLPLDGPRQTHVISYRDGIGAGTPDLPKPPAGQIAWVQPVVVSATGTEQWGPALPVDPALAIVRQPANLLVSLTAQPERTVKLKTSQSVSLIKGKEKLVLAKNAQVSMLESFGDEPRGARVRTAFSTPQLSAGGDGRAIPIERDVVDLLQRIPPTFVVDGENKLRARSDINLNPSLPIDVRDGVNEYYAQICNAYEVCNITLPNRLLQPQQNWQSMAPILIKTGRSAEVFDLVLTCTLEGTRTRQNAEEALISVRGQVEGRGAQRNKVGGQVDGKFSFDLKGGFVSSAQFTIKSESNLGADTDMIAAFEIELERSPGNPLNIALAPTKESKLRAIRGQMVAQLTGLLAPTDPFDTEIRGSRVKILPLPLQAGTNYVFQLESSTFDPYMRLLSPSNQLIAKDDDSGGGLNSRIDYRPVTEGIHRIVVASFNGRFGPFQLKVFADKGGAMALGKEPIAKKDGPVTKFTEPKKSAGPTSYLSIASSPGDYIGQGKSYKYAGDQVRLKRNNRGISANVAGWNLSIGAPNGEFLQIGEYTDAKRFAFSGNSPGLDFSGMGRGSNRLSGEFVVWELETQGDEIIRVAIDFTQRSNETGPPLHGKLRFNSTCE